MENLEILSEDYTNFDHSFKIILIGDSGTGKSCLIDKAIKNSFIEANAATIGFEFATFNIRINKAVIKLQIWDTCGPEVYRSLITNFYKASSLTIIFYSIDNKKSFKNIENWLDDCRKHNPNSKIFLVGNKSDMEESRKVSKDDGEKFAKEHKLDMFFEVSAKSGYNAQMVLIEAAILLYSEYKKNKEKENDDEEDSEEKEKEEKDIDIKDNKDKKCSLDEHKENDAKSFCPECKIFMCTKCEKMHSGLFKNHHQYNLNNINEIFFDVCKEKNHPFKLDYFCENHNQLCCAACIAKVKYKGNGKHKDCNVCSIKRIKEKKKANLNENIEKLENLSNKIEQAINELKIMLEKIDKNKEELKSKIQLMFTKIRNEINKREDELLLETDKLFEELFFDAKIIKKSEKLPQEIKIYLEKGKKVNEQWNDKDKLSSNINDCINIENTIKDIKNIDDKIENFNKMKNYEVKVKFNEEQLENFLKEFKKYGEISYDEKKLQEKKEEENKIEEEKDPEEKKEKEEKKDPKEKKDKEEKKDPEEKKDKEEEEKKN